MPPKRKEKEETRNGLELEIDEAVKDVQRGEAAVLNCKTAAQELNSHSARVKQLEQELAPKEAEIKAVHDKFQRLLEASCVSRRARGAAQDEQVVNSPPASQTSFRKGRSSTRKSPQSPVSAFIQQGSDQEEREPSKILQAAGKEFLHGVLTPLFLLPRTSSEFHNAGVIAAKVEEAHAGVTEQQKAIPTPRKGKQSTVSIPLAQQPFRVEWALCCPPGIDLTLHQDVLKLREARLNAEKLADELNAQLKISRDILTQRREEGCGTKAAQKRAEKELQQLLKAKNALLLRKEEEDILKRKAEEQAALKKQGTKTRN